MRGDSSASRSKRRPIKTNAKPFATQALRLIEASAATSIWDAHRGCALLARALLVKQNLVSSEAKAQIEERLRTILDIDQAILDPRVPTVSFDEFAHQLLEEMSIGAATPTAIGHDVIYSAYVLRAIEIFEIAPWVSLLEAIKQLIREVKRSGPGWITINGKKEFRALTEDSQLELDDYWVAFRDFDRPLSMEIDDMQLGHLLTHGHAIEMLRGHGDDEFMQALHTAYRKRWHGLLAANRDQRDQCRLRQRPIDPRQVAYWEQVHAFGDMHGHAVKYAYSFLDLKREAISEDDLRAFGRIVWPEKPVEVFD